jgi:hypothetical protein
VRNLDIATTLITDNRVVFHILQRGYTLNEQAVPDTLRITNHLAQFNIALFVRWTPSEANCADPFTRWSAHEVQTIMDGGSPDLTSREQVMNQRATGCKELAKGQGAQAETTNDDFPLSNVAPDVILAE